ALFLVARRSHRALALLDDAPRAGNLLFAIGELACPRAQLLALRLKTRDGSSVARDQETEHRHRLHRIAAIVDRQQHAHVTQSAESIECGQTLAQKLLFARDARSNGRDLRLRLATLLFELRLHVDGELQLVGADAEL